MARQPRAIEQEELAPIGPITEVITYVPGPMDPPTVKWCGHTFQANVPKEITGHTEGNERERVGAHMIENARGNKFYVVGNARPKRNAMAEPKTAEEYRAYMVGWMQEPGIQHADQMIARFARDRELQLACEVGSDDYSYLGTLFMPRLSDLARADELSEGQIASLWINHGVNQLPW